MPHPSNLYHALLTRFAVRPRPASAVPSRRWLERRFALFERFCLPSVVAQSRRGFEWLLFYDSHLDEIYVNRLEEYSRRYGFVVPLAMPRHWDVAALHEVVRGRIPSGASRLLTSRLDNDDVLAVDYVERILTHLHTSGRRAIVFDWGLNLVDGRLYWQPLLRGPFASVVADIEEGEDICTVLDDEHEHLDDVMPVVHVGRPSAWIQIIHGENLANVGRGIRVPRSVLRKRFPVPALGADVREPLGELAFGAIESGLYFSRSLLVEDGRAVRAIRYLSGRR